MLHVREGDRELVGPLPGLPLLKSFVTSESDLGAIWKRFASNLVLGFCLGFLLCLTLKYAWVRVGLESLNNDCTYYASGAGIVGLVEVYVLTP